MMEFRKRNTQKTKRNGEIIGATSSSTAIFSKGGDFKGNYLPAKISSDGTYTVDAKLVKFTGSVAAGREVTAYAPDESSEGGGDGKIIVDSAFSETSENTLQNKVITLKFKEVETNIGLLGALTTQDNSSIVAAINEVAKKGGSFPKLPDEVNAYVAKGKGWDKLSNNLNGYVNSITTSGNGNAITSVSKNGNVLTFTKGATFIKENGGTWDISISGNSATATKVKDNTAGLDGGCWRFHWEGEDGGYRSLAVFNLMTREIVGLNESSITSGDSDKLGGQHPSYYAKAADVKSFITADDLNGYVNSITTSGNGNAITSVSKNGKGLTFTKGATFVDTSSTQTIGGYKTFSNSLKVNSDITATGEVTAYSDRRLKTEIMVLKNRGAVIPVSYEKDGKRSIGFIAQDVKEIYPELVHEDDSEEKYLSVNYAQYVAVLQAQIIELEERVKKLERRLS